MYTSLLPDKRLTLEVNGNLAQRLGLEVNRDSGLELQKQGDKLGNLLQRKSAFYF